MHAPSLKLLDLQLHSELSMLNALLLGSPHLELRADEIHTALHCKQLILDARLLQVVLRSLHLRHSYQLLHQLLLSRFQQIVLLLSRARALPSLPVRKQQ